MNKSVNVNLLKTINLIVFLLTVVINALANMLPINGQTTGEISYRYQNLFTPAALTFSIWGIIYLGLGLFILYQIGIFKEKMKEDVILNIGWLFTVSSLANVSWILLWHYQKIATSLLAMCILLYALSALYLKVRQNGFNTIKEKIFIKVPFSIYLGWISVATIANVAAVLTSINWNRFGIADDIWTIVVIIIATVLTFIFLYKYNDVLYSAVVLWAFAGIFIKHITYFQSQYNNIIITIIVCFILICSYSLKKLLFCSKVI